MGYTHFFGNYCDNPKPIGPETLELIKKVVAEFANILCYEDDQQSRPPIVREDHIRFNGKGDYGLETFVFTLDMGSGGCETGMKRYDLPVCIILLLLKKFYGKTFKLITGSLEDGSWPQAIDWVRRNSTEKEEIPLEDYFEHRNILLQTFDSWLNLAKIS